MEQRKRFRHGFVYLLFVLAVGVIIVSALQRNVPTQQPQPYEVETLSSLRWGLAAGVVVSAVIALVISGRVLGPIIQFIPQKAMQRVQPESQKKKPRTLASRLGCISLLVVLAVGVIIMTGLATMNDEQYREMGSECCEPRPSTIPFGIAVVLPLAAVLGSAAALWLSWRYVIPNSQPPMYIPDEPIPEDEPDPQIIQPIRRELEGLGFTLINRRRPKQPAHPTAASAWAFASDDRRVIARTGAAEGNVVPYLLLSTFFTDGAVLETRFPMGTRFNMPLYHARVVSSGVPQAYVGHRQEVEKLRARHGEPTAASTPEMLGSLNQQYLAMHGTVYQQKSIRAAYGTYVGTLVIALALLALTLITYMPTNAIPVCYLLPLEAIMAVWAGILAWAAFKSAQTLKAQRPTTS